MPDPSQRAPDKITRFVVEGWERLPPVELVKKLPTTWVVAEIKPDGT
jgi:hypothetical protein